MTAEDIQTMIDAYLQAEKDVLSGKTITFRGQTMTYENLDQIIKGRKDWERRLANSQPGGGSYSLATWQ